MKKKIKSSLSPVLLTGLGVVIIGSLAVGFYSYTNNQNSGLATNTHITATSTPTANPAILSPTPIPTATPVPFIVTGTLKSLATDLGLVDTANQTNISGGKLVVIYYSAGTYTSGTYAGYTRIIAVKPAVDPSGISYYQFATKDNTTYTLDGDSSKVSSSTSPYNGLNTKKVTNIQNLPSDFPSTITLNNNYGLIRDDGYQEDTTLHPVADASNNLLTTDFSSYTKLATQGSNLTFYATPANRSSTASDTYTTYVAATSKVIAVDSTGLAVTYAYGNQSAIQAYSAKLAAYSAAVTASNQSNGKVTYPDPVAFPGISLKTSEIKTSSTVQLYTSYDKALPQACASDSSTVVLKNILQTDLINLGTYQGNAVYGLKDQANPLIQLAYAGKIDNLDGATFKEINPSLGNKPTVTQYATKNPLLFIKDYWGRLLGLGEYDYKIPGGCGKPVVYLYPTVPTKISVNFLSPMKLTTSIPFYQGSWQVLAQPNGSLTDLQPKYTDCSAPQINKRGSEYAANACAKNTYPYLYWAGTSLRQQYPSVTSGWAVPDGELSSLLNQKLDQVGLTPNEKNDMLSYWLPELQNTKAPYFRISFLQTAQMNKIVPMKITPAPESLLRIFLDWEPLQTKPSQELPSETVQPFHRNGFSVVEWGGLKRSAE